jgi:hypothetical protein
MIGEIYVPNRFPIGIEFAGLVILSIAPIFLPKLGMRTFRFWIRDWVSVLITRKLTIWKVVSAVCPNTAPLCTLSYFRPEAPVFMRPASRLSPTSAPV